MSAPLAPFESDALYELWRTSNPNGFVLNTDHSFTKALSVIHKATCSTLAAAAAHTEPGRLTQGTYYKVGSGTVQAARDWLRNQRPVATARLCGTCFGSEIHEAGNDGLFGYEVGALYHRRDDLHGRFGGQTQGGISTPKAAPVILLFTGEAGLGHGYEDEWADDGTFHYVGEGQLGDMQFTAGNLAIRNHESTGRALLLFQALGKGQPYRFMGRFRSARAYQRANVPDSSGNLRTAIVFELHPLADAHDPTQEVNEAIENIQTTAIVSQEVRTKQDLFRRRVARLERGCRITGIRDLRFLRASHIMPWSLCPSSMERLDPHNGLLLAPHFDQLFDAGWISFSDTGRLMISPSAPEPIVRAYELTAIAKRSGTPFTTQQMRYLSFHRTQIFRANT